MASTQQTAGAATRTLPRVPEGYRVYAVGDIHGRADLLARLHRSIRADAERTRARHKVLVYLGDYIDRGPDSRDVVNMLVHMPLGGFETIHLKGNHEDLLLDYLDGGDGRVWLFNGGDATLASYGEAVYDPYLRGSELERLRRRLLAGIPADHLAFLRGLKTRHAVGDYLFVHAGVRPGVALDDQKEKDLIWIRGPFLDATEDFGKVVVHGHTIHPTPELLDNRIGIDTGAFATNRLTCLVLEGADRRILQT